MIRLGLVYWKEPERMLNHWPQKPLTELQKIWTTVQSFWSFELGLNILFENIFLPWTLYFWLFELRLTLWFPAKLWAFDSHFEAILCLESRKLSPITTWMFFYIQYLISLRDLSRDKHLLCLASSLTSYNQLQQKYSWETVIRARLLQRPMEVRQKEWQGEVCVERWSFLRWGLDRESEAWLGCVHPLQRLQLSELHWRMERREKIWARCLK